MHRTCKLLLTTACVLPALCWAQEAPPPSDEQAELQPNPEEEQEDFLEDRPLARAMAYERRDLVEELLLRPHELTSNDVLKVAEDVSIPAEDAKKIARLAKKRGPQVLRNIAHLVRAALPEGTRVPPDLRLKSASATELSQALGISKAKAREVVRFRKSALRFQHHMREVEAIQKARQHEAKLRGQKARALLKGPMSNRLRVLGSALGLNTRLVGELQRAHRLARNAKLQAKTAQLLTGSRDALSAYRNAKGQVDWKQLSKLESLEGASGAGHFMFSLFLKELAVSLHPAEQLELEQFMANVLSTEFLSDYVMFASGARAADAAYGQMVRRMTKKRFLSGVMRSNLVLAAGLAVPMVVRGQFAWDVYLVDVAALGASATAVKGISEGVRGLYRASRLPAIRLGKFASPAGWVLTAGETAIVLIATDWLAPQLDRILDDYSLRGHIQDAGGRLEELLARKEQGQPVSETEILAAVLGVEAAYDALRQNQTGPLQKRLGEFQGVLEEQASEQARTEDATPTILNTLAQNPATARFLRKRFGTVDAYVDVLQRRATAKTDTALQEKAASFASGWDTTLKQVYEGETTEEDPAPRPGSRLATYDEQTTALLAILDRTEDEEARQLISLAIGRVRHGRAVDRTIYKTGCDSTQDKPESQPGLEKALRGSQQE